VVLQAASPDTITTAPADERVARLLEARA